AGAEPGGARDARDRGVSRAVLAAGRRAAARRGRGLGGCGARRARADRGGGARGGRRGAVPDDTAVRARLRPRKPVRAAAARRARRRSRADPRAARARRRATACLASFGTVAAMDVTDATFYTEVVERSHE